MSNPNMLRNVGIPVSAVILAGGAIACGGSPETPAAPVSTVMATRTVEAPTTTTPPPPASASPNQITYTFDDLGGSYPTVNVYADPGPNGSDSVITSYPSGKSFPAICHTKGRMIPVKTNLGEIGTSVDDWTRINTDGHREVYAPNTYGRLTIPKGLFLKECAEVDAGR